MSRLTRMLAASQALSITAMEEASRVGLRTATIEHLLLALTVDEGIAGQALRANGVTIEAARDAIAQEQAAQLASIGVESSYAPGPIVFHSTGGYEWSDQALAVLQGADAKHPAGYPGAVLAKLCAEQNHSASAIIRRCDASPEAVLATLEHAASNLSPATGTTIEARKLRGRTTAFIPAPPSEVWALLEAPENLPLWQELVATVTPVIRNDAQQPQQWITTQLTTLPNGKPLRQKAGFEKQFVTLVLHEPEHTLAWRFEFPDKPQTNARLISFSLEPAASGTQLAISHAWERPAGRKPAPLVGFIMSPLYRFALWMQLGVLSRAVSRAFRSAEH
ncbi:SRPBCC family protein [Leucobacter sp. UCMA 4100]|uniref:SRPBCC family protein n=1 Tax=Leucobacter sp. UCMA 4100 TaxID=2810534 RepID=UPI0022EAACCE|nr:Clp protease N-terminal domain-containing protein [Leucobacter sp. UCMA 4100]MDA3148039.1 SRPBCC family protein [Leucobacter sp. UCMA 4100]